MTPQIKQRIEQIRRGEVPEGYKKTKVGIVPADWQEHKLSHYLTVNNDKNTDLKYTKDDVFSISGELGIVNQIELLGRSYAGVSVAPYGIVYPNDVVYTKSPLKANPYGIIKTNKLGVTGIVSTLYAIFHCNNNVSPDYVQLYFESDHNLNNYLYPIVNIGAKHDMKISDEGSLRGTVVFPPLPEQEKIAAILQTEDKVIELHQKKINELKRLKKVYLSKMFPKKDCNVPEIRFPGFTEPWEQRKAIDIADYSKGNGYSKGDLTDAGTPIILYGRLYTKYQFAISEVDTFAVPQNGAVYSQGNEVIVPASGETAEDIARASAVEKSGVLLGGDLNILRPFDFINPLFLALAISNGEPQKELAKKAQGKSVVHIHNTDIQEVTIAYPSKTEQDRIVSVFRHLDHLITLHQRKCDEEKQKKKALMQLLLTGIVRTNK